MDNTHADIDLTPILTRGLDHVALYNPATIYVYQLCDEHGAPWYVGTTKSLAARYLAHLALQTKDTAARVWDMDRRGHRPTMRVVDVTTKEHRLPVEAYWIDATPSAVNSHRYPRHLATYRQCPTCYRSLLNPRTN